MSIHLVLATLLVQAAQPQQPEREAVPALQQAYLDEGARALVQAARDRHEGMNRSIASFSVLAHSQQTGWISALNRERLLFRCESVARVEWRRDAHVDLHILAQREISPLNSAQPFVRGQPSGCGTTVFDPTDGYLVVGLGGFLGASGEMALRQPLARGSEEDFRFLSGDTMLIVLPDGRRLQLIELQFLPARRDYRITRGSVWIDAESFAPVRTTFRLSRAFDLERDAAETYAQVPALLKPVRADLQYVTVEYGLWDMQWWLPRSVATEGVVEFADAIRFPVRSELVYSEFEIVAGDPDIAARRPTFLGTCPPDTDLPCHCRANRCWLGHIHLPEDYETLLSSSLLTTNPFSKRGLLLGPVPTPAMSTALKSIPPPEWQIEAPRFRWGLSGAGLVRFNRIEGISVGGRGDLDLGRLEIDGTLRFGSSDRVLSGELGLVAEPSLRRMRLAAYRRLAAANPETNPLGLGNSLNALLFGRDDGEYFRAAGLELRGLAGGGRAPRLEWRVYAERQRAAEKTTNFSLRYVIDEQLFRENTPADPATQIGGAVSLRRARGLNPAAFRWSVETGVEAALGDFSFVKPGATIDLTAALATKYNLSMTLAGGASLGRLPTQSQWWLGGPTSLRGYPGAALHGDTFWLNRMGIVRGTPRLGLAVFGDAGWAGPRRDLGRGSIHGSAGAGLSLFDGLLRIDAARRMRRPTGWRADIYLGGTF